MAFGTLGVATTDGQTRAQKPRPHVPTPRRSVCIVSPKHMYGSAPNRTICNTSPTLGTTQMPIVEYDTAMRISKEGYYADGFLSRNVK